MKILVICQDFIPNIGGISIYLDNLCKQLVYLGHHVDILTSLRKTAPELKNREPYRVYRYVFQKRPSSIFPIYRTLALFLQHHYDVVFIGHFMTTHALGALFLQKFRHVPYVILSHGNDLLYSLTTKVDQWVAHLLLDNVSLMLANSLFTLKLIREAGYAGPTEVLNPGVDVAGFYPNVDTSKVRHKYELDGRRVLLTVARLETRKNVESVLRALPKVVVKVPNILYLVVGDGEERERLEALCDDLGLGPYVRFLGYIENSQLPALYCASDVFVLLSIETFGISFIEASACAKPVVCGSSGAATEAVIHGETGLIVNTHNLDEIATAIVCLLTNQELARRLGENGRRRVEQKFTWEQVSKQLVIYFETVKR